MSQDTTMLIGFALLAGGAYLYTKKQGEQAPATRPYAPSSPGPVADQGKEPGVTPDAPPTGSGPSFPTELAPESAQPPSGGNSSADDLTYLENFKRGQQAISLQGSRSGGGTKARGTYEYTQRGIQVDDKYGSDEPSDDPLPSDPREAAQFLE